MVGVYVCDKDMANFFVCDMCLVKLSKNAVAPTGVNEHAAAIGANIEASVVTACTHCIAGAQKSYSIHIDNFSL